MSPSTAYSPPHAVEGRWETSTRTPSRRARKFSSRKRVADLTLLEPVTRKLVPAIIADAKEHGVELMVFETYRSKQRQTDLFNNGATLLKNVGVHHYGLACDLVRDINGEPSWKGDFSLVGRFAHHHQLIWAGIGATTRSTTPLSTLYMYNVARSHAKPTSSAAPSTPTPPTTPTRTGNDSRGLTQSRGAR